MMRQLSGGLALLVALATLAPAPAWAGRLRGECMCSGCARCRLRRLWLGRQRLCRCRSSDCCGTITRTIYVPECTTEMRTVTRVRYNQEQREKTITVYNRVPVTEEKTATYTVMVPETHTKTVTYNVCKPVWETKTREYTVNVPYTEQVEQKYTVCVPYTSVHSVCRTTGRAEVHGLRAVHGREGSELQGLRALHGDEGSFVHGLRALHRKG